MALSVRTLTHSLSQTLNIPLKPAYQPTDWRRVLLDVKLLYLKGEYKQCVLRCEQLLGEFERDSPPFYAIYLHFYAAISLELQAESVHVLSSNRLPLLENAKEHFHSADSRLPPVPMIVQAAYSPDDVNDVSPGSASSVETVTPDTTPDTSISSWDDQDNEQEEEDPLLATPTSRSSPGTSSFHSSMTRESYSEDDGNVFLVTPTSHSSPGGSSLRSPATSIGGTKLKPSPLRPRKLVRFSSLSLLRESALTPAPLNPVKGETESKTFLSVPNDVPSSAEGLSRGRSPSRLHDISVHLATHLSQLETQIAQTIQDQASRRVTRFADLRGAQFDEEVRAMDRRARIERLRKQGWRKERFDPGRYQQLARKALAEL